MLWLCTMGAGLAGAGDEAFERFIRPVTNPVYFDDARSESYIHLIYAYQRLPSYIKTTAGRVPLDGNLRVTALALNYAINERFTLVAAKDGYIDCNPDNTKEHGEGWADLAAGLKYAFIRSPAHEFILSGKLLVELSQGSREVLQGNGSGNIAPSLTFLKGIGSKGQVSGMFGGIIPFNNQEESTVLFDSWHVSYAVTPKFFPLIELNHFWVVRQARRDDPCSQIAKFEGGDLINLGARHGTQNRHFVSLAAGARYRCMKNMDIGFAYEFPLSDRHTSLMEDRITFDLIFRF